MPGMPRGSKKAEDIAFSIMGKPANMRNKKSLKRMKKLNRLSHNSKSTGSPGTAIAGIG